MRLKLVAAVLVLLVAFVPIAGAETLYWRNGAYSLPASYNRVAMEQVLTHLRGLVDAGSGDVSALEDLLIHFSRSGNNLNITGANVTIDVPNGLALLARVGSSGGTGTNTRFENVNAANVATTVQIANSGLGNGLDVTLPVGNGARAINITHSGVGPGAFAVTNSLSFWGISNSISGAGILGDNATGECVVGRGQGGVGVGAVVGRNDNAGYGVRGFNTMNGIGVLGQAGISGGTGRAGRFENVNAANVSNCLEVATNSAGNAAAFTGNVVITGNLTVSGTVAKGGGAFQIDHPLDPENKYLSHSFVESPEMKNVYDGVATLDAEGQAWVEMPAWFEALNRDFRYQLTAIGAPGPNLHVADEIDGNRFRVAGGAAGMRVSWQVTGVRQDEFANAHRVPVESDKPESERGPRPAPVFEADAAAEGPSLYSAR